MVAEYFEATKITDPDPDLQGVYKTAGIYNTTNYYKEMGHDWCIWYNSGNYKFIISQALGIVTSPFFMHSQVMTIVGTYLPQLGATGTLSVSQIHPNVYRETSQSQLSFADTLTGSMRSKTCDYNWVRWCYASINAHFNDRKGPYTLYIEGDDRDELDEAEFAELRIDGPFITIPQKHLFVIDVEINVLCQTHKDPRQHYKAQKMVGTFLKAFTNLIEVFKYGAEAFDDGLLLGCFHLQRDLREALDINYYGIIRPDTKLMQTTIEGHYRLELWTKENS